MQDRPSDTDRELNALRLRAYGPDPDIEADPAALARLVELEAAHSAAAAAAAAAPTEPPDGDRWRSHRRRATETVRRRGRLVTGSVVVAVLLVYSAWLLAPRPDATLRPTAGEASDQLIANMHALGFEGDPSSLRTFEPYLDVELWSMVDVKGLLCLMVVTGDQPDHTQCVPPGVELSVDFDPWPSWGGSEAVRLPDGSVIRFHLREDAVDVYVYPASKAG